MRRLGRSVRWAISAGLVALLSVLMPQAVRADIALTVEPTFLEFSGDPGASTSQVIRVTNEGLDPIHVSVAIGSIPAAREENSAAIWLSTDKQHLELGPGESQEVKVTIRIPGNADPGGFYAAVHFQAGASATAVEPGRWGGGTGVGASVVSSFLITVRSPNPEELKLQGAVVRVVPVAKGKEKLGFRVEMRNTGDVHFAPEGEVELRDMDGNVIGTLPLPEGVPVYPGTTRSYYFSGALDVLPGDYTASARVDYSWDRWQAEVANGEPDEWSEKAATAKLEFNSVPKLRVKSVTPVVEADRTLRIDVEVENTGDVEVSPEGFLDVLTSDGDRAFAANLGSAGTWIAPGSATVASVEYGGVMPRGDYTVRAVLSYHGEEEARKTEFIRIDEDVVPPPAPNLPEERRAQLTVGKGLPAWVTVVALVCGAAGAVALTLVVQRYRLMPKAMGLGLSRRLGSAARKVQEYGCEGLRRLRRRPPGQA